jgi:hypothetical protein
MMTKGLFTLTVIRLLALYWFINIWTSIPTALTLTLKGLSPLTVVITSLSGLLIPVAVWIIAPYLAKLLNGSIQNSSPDSLSIEAIEITFLTLLGMYMVLEAIPDFIFGLSLNLKSKSVIIGNLPSSAEGSAEWLASLVDIAIGLLLAIRPKIILDGAKRLQKFQFVKD